jgi:hypothetical protein
MSTKKAFQWLKENGALAFLLGSQLFVILSLFTWLAVTGLQSLEQPTGKDPAVFAKHLPATPAATDSQTVGARPAASKVK